MSKAKLSDRCRPNSEVSPWIHEEIVLLEKQIEGLEQSLSKRIAGECCCPHSTGSSEHFPSCPMIDKIKIAELDSDKAELVNRLEEAIDDIDSWASYAGDYFQDKHDLKGCLEDHRNVLAKHQQPDSGEQK